MRKRLIAGALAVFAATLMAIPVFAQGQAQVRVFHASPDAPAVDVLVDGAPAFTNLAFPAASDYASLDAGRYNVQVVPTGETEPAVIDADLALDADTSYTVFAVGQLENIEPLVLTDNRAAPADGRAHVRIVHASPDAPAVDVAVTDGPVLFENLAFTEATDFTPVDAGTYDLEVRVAGTEDVALSLPGTDLPDGAIVTVVARGLLADDSLGVSIVTYDAEQMASEDGATEEEAAEEGEQPETMPRTGAAETMWWLVLAGLIVLTLGAGARFATQRSVR